MGERFLKLFGCISNSIVVSKEAAALGMDWHFLRVAGLYFDSRTVPVTGGD